MDTNSALGGLLKSSKNILRGEEIQSKTTRSCLSHLIFVSTLFEVPLEAALFHFLGNFYVHLFISSGAF